MKKITFIVLTLMLCSCSSSVPDIAGGTTPETQEIVDLSEYEIEETAEEIHDLTGAWVEAGYEDLDVFMYGAILDGQIEVMWNMEENTIHALYWAGTYTPPTEPGSYSWVSENDTEKTGSALFASGDDTKEFLYEDGVLYFWLTVSGVSRNIKMVPASEEAIAYINNNK